MPVLALKAGVDQLLNPPDLAVAWNARPQRPSGAASSREARLDESILRILRLKEKLGLFERPVRHPAGAWTARSAPAPTSPPPTGSPSAPRPCWPTRAGCCRCPGAPGRGSWSSAPTRPPRRDDGTADRRTGRRALTELGFTATALSTGTAPTAAKIDEAVAAARGQDAVIVGTYNVTGRPARSAPWWPGSLATGVPVVALAIRNPYDIAQLPACAAALAAYSWTDVELRAAARVIAGRASPAGGCRSRCSADDPVLYPIGHGLSY